jgi:toxin ParE1/3/4
VTKRFRLSPDAASDIREIWAYIAAENVRAARKVRLQIFAACEELAQNPGIGHTREDLTDRHVKFWPVGSYLVVYAPETRPLEIVRVFHGALDIPRLI